MTKPSKKRRKRLRRAAQRRGLTVGEYVAELEARTPAGTRRLAAWRANQQGGQHGR
jgi:hypothetical protein